MGNVYFCFKNRSFWNSFASSVHDWWLTMLLPFTSTELCTNGVADWYLSAQTARHDRNGHVVYIRGQLMIQRVSHEPRFQLDWFLMYLNFFAITRDTMNHFLCEWQHNERPTLFYPQVSSFCGIRQSSWTACWFLSSRNQFYFGVQVHQQFLWLPYK